MIGRTHQFLVQQFKVNKLEDLSAPLIKESLEYALVPDAEAWRVPLAEELTNIRDGKSALAEFSHSEIEEMLVYVCSL